MQQTQPQQDKPQRQGELRTIVWQNGKSTTESLPETLQEVLHDPHAVIWLDIQGECGPQQALLYNVFELAPITLQTIDYENIFCIHPLCTKWAGMQAGSHSAPAPNKVRRFYPRG